MKMVMEKLWNRQNWQQQKKSCNFTDFASDIYHICVFAGTNKYSIGLEILHFGTFFNINSGIQKIGAHRWSWKIKKQSWKIRRTSFCKVCWNPDYSTYRSLQNREKT